MRQISYTTIICTICNSQEEMCISGMPLSGLCTTCRKKQWRKDNPQPKQPTKFCSICSIKVGRNNNLLLCKDCYRKQSVVKIRAQENAKIYVKERKKKDPCYKLSLYLRSRLAHAIREGHHKMKCGSHVLDLGCTIEELKKYIETKFTPGMSWNNWSKSGWHIDHIRPLSSVSTPEELIFLCHYSNLQPLWAKENLSKGGMNRIFNREFYST